MTEILYNHTLVVGGSGMLSDVSLELVNTGAITSVVGRDPAKIKRLKDLSFIYPGKINPIISDYQNLPQFIIDVIMAEEEHGPISLAVVWIHSNAPKAATQLASLLNHNPCRFVHVLSSEYAKSDSLLDETIEKFSQYKNIDYHPTILGYKSENNRNRWLTHKEISNGVIDAIKSDTLVNTVGETEPWESQ